MHQRKHRKHPGVVSDINGTTWWATIVIDGHEYDAEMLDPLPPGKQVGFYFWVHQTKAGRTYLFWPPPKRIFSHRKRKKILRELRTFALLFQQTKDSQEQLYHVGTALGD